MEKDNSQQEVKWPEGIRAFRPRENAPEFLKLNVVIEKSRLIAWLELQESEEIRLDLLSSKKEGNPLYFSLNTWKKDATPQPKLRTIEMDAPSDAEAEFNSLGEDAPHQPS